MDEWLRLLFASAKVPAPAGATGGEAEALAKLAVVEAERLQAEARVAAAERRGALLEVPPSPLVVHRRPSSIAVRMQAMCGSHGRGSSAAEGRAAG